MTLQQWQLRRPMMNDDILMDGDILMICMMMYDDV
jgi:hypothetical protein